MTTNTAVPKTFLLLTQSLCVSAVLICSHSNYLGSFGQLICAGRSLVQTYYNPSGIAVAQCSLSNGLCDTRNVSASGINNTHTVLNISRVETTDAGEWSCTAGLHIYKCDLTVVKTPTCNITSKEDTYVLVQYQELTLTVNVRDYYCSTAHNVSLRTGNVTTLLMEADSVPSVSDNTSSVTLNVTDSHLGKVGLVFRCGSSQWRLTCDGLTDLVPKTTTCDITSDKDTETLTLHEEVRLTVNITAYYYIRGSYCSADSDFTLQTGDVKQILNVGDQGLQPVTINVTKTHLGGVRLVFNCQDKHWNLSCDGVTELNNRRDCNENNVVSNLISEVVHLQNNCIFSVTETDVGGVKLVFNCKVQHWNLPCDGVTELNSDIKATAEPNTVSTPLLIAGVIGAVLFLSVVINIACAVKRKVSESAVHLPMDGTVAQTENNVVVGSDRPASVNNQRAVGLRINPIYIPTAVGDSKGLSNSIAIRGTSTETGGDYVHTEARGEYVALDRNAVQPSNIYEHLRLYEQVADM